MSEFDSELGNGSIAIVSKVTEGVFKIIGAVFGKVGNLLVDELLIKRTGADYLLKKEQLDAVTISSKVGYVEYEKLLKTKEPLSTCGIKLDKKEFARFANLCYRSGIAITGVEDVRERNLNGKSFKVLMCKTKDLSAVKNLIDLMNDEKRIEAIHREITKLEAEKAMLVKELNVLQGKKTVSEEDTARIDELNVRNNEIDVAISVLKSQIEEIRYGHSQELNAEQSKAAVDKVISGDTLHGMNFNEAMDRYTGGHIDKDTTCYVVDAKNPNRYIVCSVTNDSFRGEDYIKTIYEVHKDGKTVYTTDDSRFEGRQWDYWTKEKEAMKTAGGFGDMVYKFYTADELEAYRQSYNKQNEAELGNLNPSTGDRNYEDIITELQHKLAENGAKYDKVSYKEGIVVDKQTGKALELSDTMDEATKANIAESIVIGKQIDNYLRISRLENDLALVRADVAFGPPSGLEMAIDREQAFQQEYNKALDYEKVLIDERKSINAVQAEQEVQDSDARHTEHLPEDAEKITALETEISVLHKEADDLWDDYERTGNMDSFSESRIKRDSAIFKKEQLEDLKSKAAQNAMAKKENVIDERISDKKSEKKLTLTEYRKRVSELKGEKGANIGSVVRMQKKQNVRAPMAVSK